MVFLKIFLKITYNEKILLIKALKMLIFNNDFYVSVIYIKIILLYYIY